MPLPVITDTMRVAVEGVLGNGHLWANVLHFRKTSALTYSGAITILDPLLLNHFTVNAGAGQAWKALAATTASIQQFRYTPLDGTTITTIIGHVSAGSNSTDQELPAGVALATTFYTDKRGRAYRGRCYYCGLTEGSNLGGGLCAAGTALAIKVQWDNFRTALSGSGISHVVASYLARPATGKVPSADNVTQYAVNTRWDSQRRRNRP